MIGIMGFKKDTYEKHGPLRVSESLWRQPAWNRKRYETSEGNRYLIVDLTSIAEATRFLLSSCD